MTAVGPDGQRRDPPVPRLGPRSNGARSQATSHPEKHHRHFGPGQGRLATGRSIGRQRSPRNWRRELITMNGSPISRGFCGRNRPAESTAKSALKCWPGGTRSDWPHVIAEGKKRTNQRTKVQSLSTALRDSHRRRDPSGFVSRCPGHCDQPR